MLTFALRVTWNSDKEWRQDGVRGLYQVLNNMYTRLRNCPDLTDFLQYKLRSFNFFGFVLREPRILEAHSKIELIALDSYLPTRLIKLSSQPPQHQQKQRQQHLQHQLQL